MYFLLFLSLSLLSVGSYIIWFSKYNIPAHLEFAFLFTRYLIPIVLISQIPIYDEKLVVFFEQILVWGTASYVVGMLVGNKMPLLKSKPYTWFVIGEQKYCDRVALITRYCIYIGIAGMLISYAIMGFIPMFASDPLSAKFFRGVYSAPYFRVAILFRLSNYILYTVTPLCIVLYYYYRKKIYIFLLLAVMVMIATTLTRGYIAMGAITGIGILCAVTNKYFKTYLISLVLVYSLGSISYYLFGLLFGIHNFIDFYERDSIFEVIAAGAPDVSDQLNFLSAFLAHPQYTYGRTFVGGLVPGHYIWNASVWPISITNPGQSIDEITSGGLRLPLPLWGYVSFSWPGVILVSFFSGLINGYFINWVKKMISQTKNAIIITIIILLYINYYTVFVGFYALSMYSIPVMFLMSIYVYRYKF